MAWRPYENLIDGDPHNHTPGKVTGWMRFFRIQGGARRKLRKEFAERCRKHIEAGDLYFAYVSYPYVEWYSDNGRVVLELDPSQVEILDIQGVNPRREKTRTELFEDDWKRSEAMAAFMGRMANEVSEENRKRGGDGNIAGMVVG